jgi:cellulose synthase/poly-beta-1,6-N-acetylglucosamine synthase-like glycosyltransferase
MLNILFWVFIFLVIYTYLLYPLILKGLGQSKIWKYTNQNYRPEISILIPIHNEEDIIKQKIESILSSNYPLEKIEIIIYSDASTDGSQEIIKTIAQQHPFIKFHEHPKRMGKSFVVNQMVQLAKRDIVLLTDANIIFTKDAIQNNVRNYFYPQVGLVASSIENKINNDKDTSLQEKEYVSYENQIKYLEGKIWGNTVAPFGACFSFRKAYYKPIPNHFLVDDFFISTTILKQKQHCILDKDSICFEGLSGSLAVERQRRRRISAGNFQNLGYFFGSFNPFKIIGLCFWSHKGLRWLTPFFLIIILTLNTALLKTHVFYQILFVLQLLFYCIPLTGLATKQNNWPNKLLKFANYFIWMNVSLLAGFYDYCKGVKFGYWYITKRQL